MSVIKQINVYNGSAWQTGQIGADAGNITLSSNIAGSSNLQTALSNVLPVTSLSASKVVLTDTNGKISTSETVSSTQLGYLSGLSGNIQTQLDGKVSKTGDTMTGDLVHSGVPSQYLNTNFTRGTYSSSLAFGNSRLNFRDAQNNNVGNVMLVNQSDNQGIQMRYLRDSNTSNSLTLGFDNQNKYYVYVSSSSAWRDALGVNSTVTVKTASSVSVASTTYTNITNTGSISAGTYIIRGYISYPSNATGRRLAMFSSTSGGSSPYNSMVNSKTAMNGSTTYVNVIGLFTITSATTLYLVAYQSSGSTLSCSGRIELLKIH